MAGIKFSEAFGGVLKTTGQVLKQIAVKETSKIKAVQKGVEEEKTAEAKNILWTVFPILAIIAVISLLFKGR